jgi:hypothetical protein
VIRLYLQDYHIRRPEVFNLPAQRGPDEAAERPRRGGVIRCGKRQGGPRAQRGALPPVSLLLVVNTFTTERSVEKVIY